MAFFKTQYIFPPAGDKYADEITHCYTFWASRWSSFNSNRTRAKVKSNADIVITLPFPKTMMTDNSVAYNEQGAQIGGGFYERGIADAFGSPIDRISEWWNGNGGGGVGNYLGDVIMGPLAKIGSALSGGDTINYDDTETNFLPGAKRRHSFEFLLVAKNEKEASIISQIAYTFQLYTFPSADVTSSYTMQHPLIWSFSAMTKKGPSGWDNQPLVSVLQSARVSKIPFNSLPFSFSGNYQPVGTVINLAFIEVEPALRRKDKLISRSERIYGGDGGSDLKKFG